MRKTKSGKVLFLLFMMLVFEVCAHHPNLKMIDTREIRNNDNDHVLLELPEIDIDVKQEPSTDQLHPELRMPMPFVSSEVIQLLGDDETRSHELGQPSKHPGSNSHPMENPKMDCSKITMQMFQVLLQNPDTVEPEDYSCGLLNLISHFEKSHGRMRSLEASLHSATTTIKTLETNLQAEMSKTQFLVKELNETVHKESERAIKAENVIARRVLAEKARMDGMQKNFTEMLTSAMVEIKEFEGSLQDMERQWDKLTSRSHVTPHDDSDSDAPSEVPSTHPSSESPAPQPALSEQDIQKIEIKLSSLQQFMQELSNRIESMEDGSGEDNVNKGITQIFKTYASLAGEIEKETERASAEEASLKNLVTTEVSALTKQIQSLHERITEEKNRVQVIENRRTADLFEEINRAKSEENRLGQRLKDEMAKAASAFKRLELHVDSQMNSTKLFEDEYKILSNNLTMKGLQIEEKLMEQMSFERTRAQSVENSLKAHLETEVGRAISAEETLKKLIFEERERARQAEQELKVSNDVETYRAKGVEYSISAQISAEIERAKLEEVHLREELKRNVSTLFSDIIKEFTRAQGAEKELDEKITSEIARAMTVEKGIISNLNSEMNRASERENDLYRMFKASENSTELFDRLKTMIDLESHRAKQMETNLESQIQGEVSRAKVNEEKMLSFVNEELMHFKSVEQNLTIKSSDIIKHARELELEVRKTVMAEVARAVDAENGIKHQLALEVERATLAERAIITLQSGNYSDITTRLEEMAQELEKDSTRLEDITVQISRNLTGDILTLAELFDDKLDDLERSENVRLKKLEDDMKKCCTTSSWRWRTNPTSVKGKSTPKANSRTGGVISKIMQVFGALPEAEGAKKKSSSKGDASEESGQGRAINGGIFYDNEDIIVKSSVESPPKIETEKGEESEIVVLPPENSYETNISKNVTSSKNGTVEIIYGNVVRDLDKDAKSSERKTNDKWQIPRSSRRVNSVSVQTANSKVTSTYG